MKIAMHIILRVHAVWLQTHLYLKGNLREARTHAFSFVVLHVLLSYLQGLDML